MAWIASSWEITDPLLRTRWNPCGMMWTWLRGFYSFPLRCWIGGQQRTFQARWFRCLPSALFFPSPHGGEASVWLKNYETNLNWGEVTPYPTDPAAQFLRGLDRGQNPGYPGQRFIGEYQWFVDGMLPAGILDGPIPAMCPDCLPPPASAAGGVLLGGFGVPSGAAGYLASGGVVVGGAGVGAGQRGYVAGGGLVVGGAGVPTQRQTAAAAGGLVVGGAGVPAGSGPPGRSCDTAGPLYLGIPTQPFTGSGWLYFDSPATQVYHFTVTGYPPPPTDLTVTIWSGPCTNQQTVTNFAGPGCFEIDILHAQRYYLQIQCGTEDMTWSMLWNTGPCP